MKTTLVVLSIMAGLAIPAAAQAHGHNHAIGKAEKRLLLKTAAETGRTRDQALFAYMVGRRSDQTQAPTAHASHAADYLHNCWLAVGFPCKGTLSDNDAVWFMVVELVWNHSNAQSPSFHGAYHRINSSATWAWNVKYQDNRLNHVCKIDVDYVPGVPYRYYANCSDGTYHGPW